MSAPQTPPPEPLPGTTGRRIVAILIILAGFILVATTLALTVSAGNPAGRDFIEYWTAAQRLVHHTSPYDWNGVLALEKSVGFGLERPEFWYSPPSSLLLALPLGWMDARTALQVWVVALFAALCLSLWLLARRLGAPDSLLPLAGLAFAPALACLQAGQVSLFMLLGLTLFLCFHDRLPLVAGAALLPCTLKPHLFLPFALVLGLWAILERRVRLLTGFAASLGAGCAVTLYFDPSVWTEYSSMMQTEGMLHEFVPTLAEMLRYLIRRDTVWLQFVPEVLGCAWAVFYYWHRRSRWDWMHDGIYVLLIAAICRPYGWFFDEAILLPGLLAAALAAHRQKRSLVPFAVAGMTALVLYIMKTPLAGTAYLWTTPAWSVCTFYGMYKRNSNRSSAAIGEP